MNKKLLKDIEQKEQSGVASVKPGAPSAESHVQHPVAVSAAELKGIARKKLDDLQCQLEWAQMREHDLLGLLTRQAFAPVVKKPPMQRMLSRMPSTTVITRYSPSSDGASGNNGAPTRQARSGSVLSRSPEDQVSGGTEPGDSEGKFESEFAGNAIEIDEKNFEAYHQEVHRMLTEIEQGQEKQQKQQKVIAVRCL